MTINIINEIEDTKRTMTNDRIDEGAFCDYDESCYICDAISEIADYHIDIYNADLFDWAKGNLSYIEDANNEFGAPNDIIKQMQQGQYLANEEEIWNNYGEMLYIYALNLLKDNGIEELTEEQAQAIYEECKNKDHNDHLMTFEEVQAYYEE